LDERKLFWVHHTPEGQTAMNNQCINPECLYQGNTLHGAKHNTEGVNRANTDTPLYCEKCGSLLPRPYTIDKKTGEKRIMKAFVSAYKRMSWDVPASTLTQNFQYACSDNKLHPSQDRVLSLYEGLVIQTIAQYPYSFEIDGKMVPDGLIRDTIGESIPPLLTDKIVKHLIDISNKTQKER
jgi:DNA (cytosine-5)-methyltransferase 1